MKSQTIIYAGPSLTAQTIQLINTSGFRLLPPIKRTDLTELVNEKFSGNIIIADGIFQQVLAVGHKEIIKTIEAGSCVYGVSSLGAIRAYELRHYGMKGFGKVYSRFLESEDFQDDEVALLHESGPPYRYISEPLVHFRECIDHLVKEDKIVTEDGIAIISHLKG
ncbi:MAG: TfuA-like protein, partial [Aurantibacter sp.]